jgi:hypothetical protein
MTLFALTTAGFFYEKDEAKKLEKLGFTFKKFEDEITDDCRRTKASGSVEIEIDTLDELLAIAKEHGDIIVSFNEDLPGIEIYDDYRE